MSVLAMPFIMDKQNKKSPNRRASQAKSNEAKSQASAVAGMEEKPERIAKAQ